MFPPCAARTLVSFLILVVATTLPGQDPDYVLTIGSAAGDTNDTVTVDVTLDDTGGDIAGWSYGVCHDEDGATVLEILDGTTTATVNNGGPAEFIANTVQDGGFTVAVVVCLLGCAVLPPGLDYDLNSVDYALVGLAPTVVDLEFCSDLGDPAVNVAVVVNGQSVDPVTVAGSLSILGPPPLVFDFGAADQQVPYDPATGLASISVPLHLEEDAASPGFPNSITGFSMSLTHDPVFLAFDAAVPGPDAPQFEFFTTTVGADGFLVTAVVDAMAGTLLGDGPQNVVVASYDTNPGPFTFNFVGATVPLTWDTSASDLDAGTPAGITFADAVVDLFPQEAFVRGDIDDNGSPSLGDVLNLLDYLFGSGAISCLDTGDFDDDDALGLNDAIQLLGFLFLQGPPPAPPFPDCGMDFSGPTQCLLYNGCP